jgi:hypothetical protein
LRRVKERLAEGPVNVALPVNVASRVSEYVCSLLCGLLTLEVAEGEAEAMSVAVLLAVTSGEKESVHVCKEDIVSVKLLMTVEVGVMLCLML